MGLRAEIAELRRYLERLDERAEIDLARRYALRVPPARRLGSYRRMRMIAGRFLRRVGLRRVRFEPWLAGLKHVSSSEDAKPFLIWALDADRDSVRATCTGFQALLAELPGWVPVLVTDVADFAFFSRLGWLVEYVPNLPAPAERYAARKLRYLAWRYRDAPVLPMSVGLQKGVRIQELLVDRL